jgi:hypothetical protein
MRTHLPSQLAPLVIAALVAVYAAVYLPFLPNAQGLWADDYSLHFPNLLVGLYWRLANGLVPAPWFNPGECGGVPYFADPNVAYYAAPQALTFFVSPTAAIRATFLAFAAAGCGFAYLLMRSSFAASRSAAAVVAGLFLFNGYYAARMLIGHLTFHAFMLAPALAMALLPGPGAKRSVGAFALRAGGGALILAYMFQSGMVHGVPPLGLSVLALALLQALTVGVDRRWPAIAASAALGALALSASKFAAEVSWLSQFPRSLYPLPGVADWKFALALGPLTLLGYAPEKAEFLVNSVWLQHRHEWEYGVSVVPAALLLVAATNALAGGALARLTIRRAALALALLALTFAPSALNFYSPGWNAVLKSLPFFGESSSLLRFFSANILPATVLAGLLVDRIAGAATTRLGGRPALAAAAIALLLLQVFVTPRAYYAAAAQYDAARVEIAAAAARAIGVVHPVTWIVDNGSGPESGTSVENCYQPIFGYRLEAFPRGPLKVGPIDVGPQEPFNLKNPACYVFPSENACVPGAQFSAVDRDRALAFAAYRPFAFERSTTQTVADDVTLAALVAFTAGALAALFGALRRALTARS